MKNLLLLSISLPLLLGGCGEKPVADVKPVEEAPINSIKYKITGDVVAITSCDKKASGTLTIPATIEGKTVTSIGKDAFGYCSLLTSITIPDSVTSIGAKAFLNCTSLTSITIPDSVTSIGKQAFADCRGLKSITIPDRVSYIGSFAFAECNSLRAVTFLGDAPKAGQRVFSLSPPIIYRNPEAKGWEETWDETVGDGTRDIPPVKLISEKP